MVILSRQALIRLEFVSESIPGVNVGREMRKRTQLCPSVFVPVGSGTDRDSGSYVHTWFVFQEQVVDCNVREFSDGDIEVSDIKVVKLSFIEVLHLLQFFVACEEKSSDELGSELSGKHSECVVDLYIQFGLMMWVVLFHSGLGHGEVLLDDGNTVFPCCADDRCSEVRSLRRMAPQRYERLWIYPHSRSETASLVQEPPVP